MQHASGPGDPGRVSKNDSMLSAFYLLETRATITRRYRRNDNFRNVRLLHDHVYRGFSRRIVGHALNEKKPCMCANTYKAGTSLTEHQQETRALYHAPVSLAILKNERGINT